MEEEFVKRSGERRIEQSNRNRKRMSERPEASGR